MVLHRARDSKQAEEEDRFHAGTLDLFRHGQPTHPSGRMKSTSPHSGMPILWSPLMAKPLSFHHALSTQNIPLAKYHEARKTSASCLCAAEGVIHERWPTPMSSYGRMSTGVMRISTIYSRWWTARQRQSRVRKGKETSLMRMRTPRYGYHGTKILAPNARIEPWWPLRCSSQNAKQETESPATHDSN